MKLLPILAGTILQLGTSLQIIRMWRSKTAQGQSPAGWLAVIFGLFLWFVFYWFETPEQSYAISITLVSILNCAIAFVLACAYQEKKT